MRYLNPDHTFGDDEGRWYLVELTQRTDAGVFLLRPGRDTRRLFIGAGAYALDEMEGRVKWLDHHCMSNHFGLLAVRSVWDLALFACLMTARLSKELKHNWTYRGASVFPNPYKMVQIADEASLRERLVYSAGNCVREKATRHARQWPGAHSARRWHNGETPTGMYHNFTAHHRKGGTLAEHEVEVSIELAKAPCWAHFDDEAYAKMMRGISDEAAERYKVKGRVRGAEAVQRVNPRKLPERIKRGGLPRTLVYTVVDTVRDAHAEAYRAAHAAYVAAGDLLRRWLAGVARVDHEARVLRARECGLPDLASPLGPLAPLACVRPPE